MAFGFFKKTETADLILHNGHIYTQDPELPWASAVACRGETIMGVGDFENMQEIIGKNTQVIDLAGKFVFPGFIDIHRSPVLKVFDGKYVDLSECKTPEEILVAVTEWAEENPDSEIIFGYGYHDNLKPDFDFDDDDEDKGDEKCRVEGAGESNSKEGDNGENICNEAENSKDIDSLPHNILDKACPDRPVLLLCENCIDCWTNSVADEIIIQTAEEEVVEFVTVDYVLNLLIPFDFDAVENDVKVELGELSDKGFTSVLNLASPDYFENLYQDSLIGLFNEGEMRQRFFGSLMINRPLIPKGIVHKLMTRRTNCLELGNMIHANMLYLNIENDTSPAPFTHEVLDVICEEVCSRGFDIFLEASSHKDMLMAYNTLEYIRAKGNKNVFVIASDATPRPEEVSDMLYWESAFKTWGTNPLSVGSLTGSMHSVEEAIDHLTIEAAKVTGMENSLGSIESGKLADMAIFDENLLETDLNLLSRVHASMTILGGEIVYDAEAENDMEMYNLMASQQL